MALVSGTRFGPYEISGPIGSGGMGEVYRAVDTRLDREVALKILPEQLAADQEHIERFEREARAVGQLNHPHICTLHDVGAQDGTRYIVMELIDGVTLEERLASGKLPLRQALEIGRQIADALDKAHGCGVIHRDLKPANVMLTRSGVKLLDFGLAKRSDGDWLVSGDKHAQTKSHLTAEGAILGTLQYMAPEQIEGKEADVRTDVYGLCLLLYEMITGQAAVWGTSQASIIAAILKDTPRPISDLEPIAPPQLDSVLRTGLAKDPEERWQSARELTHALNWIAQAAPVSERPRNGRLWLGCAAAATFLAGSIGFFLPHADTAAAQHQSLLEINTPAWTREAMISPNAQYVVFTALTDHVWHLWLRPLADRQGAVMLASTEGASNPFWKPDSRSIGFFTRHALMRYDIETGKVTKLADAKPANRGGSWNADDTIIYAPVPTAQLYRLSASVTDAKPERLPLPEGPTWWFPQFLPDGQHFLVQNYTDTWIARLGDEDKATRLIENGTSVAPLPDGDVAFLRDGKIVADALSLDGETPTLAGREYVMPGETELDWSGNRLALSASNDGTLLYLAASGPEQVKRQVYRVDRNGETMGQPIAERALTLNASSDGHYVVTAYSAFELHDLTQDRTPDHFDMQGAWIVVFSPDSKQVVFPLGSDLYQLYTLTIGSTEAAKPLWPNDGESKAVWGWTHDYILYSTENLDKYWLRSPDTDAKPIRVLETSGLHIANPQVSPDGLWIAYRGEGASQRPEIYVQSIADPTRYYRISSNGGDQPRWDPAGKGKLFFIDFDGYLMQTTIRLPSSNGEGFDFDPPEPLFNSGLTDIISNEGARYDVLPGGDEFLINRPVTATESRKLVVVQGWRPGAER